MALWRKRHDDLVCRREENALGLRGPVRPDRRLQPVHRLSAGEHRPLPEHPGRVHAAGDLPLRPDLLLLAPGARPEPSPRVSDLPGRIRGHGRPELQHVLLRLTGKKTAPSARLSLRERRAF